PLDQLVQRYALHGGSARLHILGESDGSTSQMSSAAMPRRLRPSPKPLVRKPPLRPTMRRMFEISVQRTFSAAHAIVVRGRREPLHGHDWRVTIVVAGNDLDADGLLCDFHALEAAL